MKRQIAVFFLTLLPSLLFLVSDLHACTVCFGDPGSDLSKGFYWGILMLLILPFVMLGSFVAYVVYHSRKNRPTPSSSISLDN